MVSADLPPIPRIRPNTRAPKRQYSRIIEELRPTMANRKSKARAKPRGSSKAGRPKKEGDRYPSGKLKPPGPNQEVLAKRKAGDADAGEHPLDFALSQGWVTEQQHRTASDYRRAYDHAHISAGGPRLAQGGLAEASPSEALRMKWAEMSDEAIAEIWDSTFNITAPPEGMTGSEAADARLAYALTRWKLINRTLKPDEAHELFLIAVLGSWPWWMTKLSTGKELGAGEAQKRAAFFSGLGAVSQAMRPPKPSTTIIPLPDTPKRTPKAEVPVNYVTTEGLPTMPVGRTGRAFEVVERRRRRDLIG